MNVRLLSFKSGAVAAVVAAALGFATPASSGVFLFSLPAGSTAGGQPVDAQVQFTTSANQIQVVLTNLQPNPTSIIQAISDLFFTASNEGTKLTTGTGLYGYTGNHVSIAANGTSSASAPPAVAAWNLTNTAGTYHLDKLCGGNTCGNPEGLIIGPGPYTNAQGSIAGNDAHNPFVDQSATFTLAVLGATAATVISDVVISFGTTPGTNVVIPIPAAVWLFASGLLGLIAIARRRQSGPIRGSPVPA
jgi:hypothetical protein